VQYRAAGRFEVRITPADVGKRVSVRRVAEIRGDRPAFSDTIGILTSWSEGVLIITQRDGRSVSVPESALVAGKTVPPPPTRRGGAAPAASIGELLQVAGLCWPAFETERMGGWRLRAAGGFTRRANSALALAEPELPLAQALDRTADWYAARGLVPYVQVAHGTALDESIAAHGWTAEARTLVRTAALAPLADLPGAERVHVSRELTGPWLARYHRTCAATDAARAVLSAGPAVWFATVPGPAGTDTPAAIGRVATAGRWAMFAALEVDPAHRRQGLATAVMSALARSALADGATGAFLQVEADNARAGALYDRLAFTTTPSHHYRRPPAPAAERG
jgi:GNAT superfamily N-acetyltransferase